MKRAFILLGLMLAASGASGASSSWGLVSSRTSPITYYSVSGDTSTSSDTVYSSLPGISWSIAANANQRAHCNFVITAAAATTGAQLQVTGPASPSAVTISRWYHNNSPSALSQIVRSAFDSGSTDDSVTGSCTALTCVSTVDIVVQNGANAGTIAIGLESEVNGSAVGVLKGSWCEVSSF